MTPLTNEEIAELHRLYDGGEEMALEWRAAVLAAHPFLLAEVERSRVALRERDAAHEIALKKARADALEEVALLVERRQVASWVPHGAGPAFAQLAQRIRALLEEAGK